jgi:hypothetical protein
MDVEQKNLLMLIYDGYESIRLSSQIEYHYEFQIHEKYLEKFFTLRFSQIYFSFSEKI